MMKSAIFDYLMKNETNFLSVLDKFELNYQTMPFGLDFKVFYKDGEIDSLIAYTDYGTFYPFVKERYISETVDFLNNYNFILFSIYGESSSVNEIAKGLDYKYRSYINYYTMLLRKEDFKETYLDIRSNDFTVRKCDINDFNYLSGLQSSYHKEEVYIGGYYPYEAEMEAFKQLLSNRLTYALFNDRMKALSKVNVNGESPNFCQIGGMYTLKGHRNRGYGKICLNNISRDIFTNYNKKGIMLFVKRDNLPAINVYQRLGFKILGETSICYF